MNKKFDDIYNKVMIEHFESTILSFQQRQGHQINLEYEVEAIFNQISEMPKSELLRSDAAYFLMLNIVNMVLLPILMSSNTKTSNEYVNFRRQLPADIKYILNIAKIDSDGQISGHSLINALSESWPRLKMMSLEVWG